MPLGESAPKQVADQSSALFGLGCVQCWSPEGSPKKSHGRNEVTFETPIRPFQAHHLHTKTFTVLESMVCLRNGTDVRPSESSKFFEPDRGAARGLLPSWRPPGPPRIVLRGTLLGGADTAYCYRETPRDDTDRIRGIPGEVLRNLLGHRVIYLGSLLGGPDHPGERNRKSFFSMFPGG